VPAQEQEAHLLAGRDDAKNSFSVSPNQSGLSPSASELKTISSPWRAMIAAGPCA
jgi:hypothetical protein